MATELRISVLAVDAAGNHTKHVAVHITDSKLAGAVVGLLKDTAKIDVEAAKDADLIEFPEKK